MRGCCVLRHNMNNGHTCLPADKLAPAAANFLGVDPGLAEDVLAAMKAEGSLVADDLGSGNSSLLLGCIGRRLTPVRVC